MVHQRGLRQVDERAGSGVKQDERHHQPGDAATDSRNRQRREEDYAAAENQSAPPGRIAQDADEQLDEGCGPTGDGEKEADFLVGQVQVGANQRPGGLAQPKHKLVEELDQ